MESKGDETDSLMDMSQTLLQLLGSAMPAGNALLSPLLLAQAASGSLVPGATAAAQMSLPWMLRAQYQQFVVLQQGLAQQLLVPDVSECDDGQAENQLEAAGDANPLLTAILQRHTMTQRQLQKLDDSDINAITTTVSLRPSSLLTSEGEQRQQQLQQQRPRPPKKPLTPYMIFSKEIWHQVKAANSHLSSVTEIGAIIGRLWRDLVAEKKEQYNDMFNENKIRYDEEMLAYLKENNLRPSDLTRSKISRRRSGPSSHSGFTKSHETTRQPSLGKSQNVFSSSDLNFPGQSVQQLLGQMSFPLETVFPSRIAVSDNFVVCQTQNQVISAEEADELVHVPTTSPSIYSVNREKCINSIATTKAWTWHLPASVDSETNSQTFTLSTETGVTLTEASASAQARYYNTDGLDQLLKLKEQNIDKLREFALVNDLEMQIFHLESALTERAQKADELRRELKAANLLVAHLQEKQLSTSMTETSTDS